MFSCGSTWDISTDARSWVHQKHIFGSKSLGEVHLIVGASFEMHPQVGPKLIGDFNALSPQQREKQSIPWFPCTKGLYP